ncbi:MULTISPECIES: hypothetical protein [Cycloclasticus]|jgi:hypothetical protein|uniref:Lipoprotein n=1 Tax=Cycloclasticus pugetii TaxID=34068 RepID=A0AB33Z1D9_9GAMM|nr:MULTISPECIES: hypothetical protein [Cycloclasticus]ATI02094.1 hypothetical protein CPC19_01045 [Cycloclasticus sp. PY97N]EPD13160.1 hypothetical protein L196_05945 [Cycloclasticus pugetii]MDF1829729.1 hypothetical protein [Cycloclasticus pugetii]SHJ21995.1 hypothetical protein SAMN05519226_1686 [Cycloclasticus pugetii]|tara:strand:+ start:1342 stop:2034 length:693 start_codon:yes stop_codon:yes gene_type:complete
MQNRFFLLLFLALLLSACAQVPDQKGYHYEYFNLNAMAKTDIDMVADTHVKQTIKHLRLLAIKLYKRNPREWKKTNLKSREAAVARIFKQPFPTVNGKSSVDSIRLAFNEQYQGDRVLAYVSGLASMLTLSYNGKSQFYLFDSLDAQKVYNGARNIEVASWLLQTKRKQNGELFLLSSGKGLSATNRSYDRLFGKLIGQQDLLALVIATKNHRTIKNVFQSAARFVFLPV